MIEVYSSAVDKEVVIDRLLGKIEGESKGPTIVFFAGIHGNETAGVFALKDVLKKLLPKDIYGTVHAISGNLKALEQNQRYIDKDLNRLWTKEQLDGLKSKQSLNAEEKEQIEILKLLKTILKDDSGPFYFIDFHTTSSKTLPFITINDALINRNFSNLFPVPIVLGIEEYLNGPLLSYINNLGYVSLGFESGQHNEKEAVLNCISFIYLTLVFTSAISAEKVIGYSIHYNQLKSQSNKLEDIFEIVYLYRINSNEEFKMIEGFKSFQTIKKRTVLAISDNKKITSKHSGMLFMPLYQSKGEEGFFVIKKIHPFFLSLSTVLRTLRMDSLLVLLPGITWEDNKKEVLKANLKIAKFFTKSLFHLLGYRNNKISDNHMLLYNRERTSNKAMYKNEVWQKKKNQSKQDF